MGHFFGALLRMDPIFPQLSAKLSAVRVTEKNKDHRGLGELHGSDDRGQHRGHLGPQFRWLDGFGGPGGRTLEEKHNWEDDHGEKNDGRNLKEHLSFFF